MDLKVFKLAANTKNHKLLKDYDYVLRQKNTFVEMKLQYQLKLKVKKFIKLVIAVNHVFILKLQQVCFQNFLKINHLRK